jgi:hypothetical protein
VQIEEYCREIETYLCRKNDGHLIRVVGPSFQLVSRWAAAGVPLKVAFNGIDRYFARYYRKGVRRRPVRIDFCEADVLDVFDEWRRAVGLPAAVAGTSEHREEIETPAPNRSRSLPLHLQRVVLHLTNARATGILGPSADDLIDRVARELDAVRSHPAGLRGEARRAVLLKLAALDEQMLDVAKQELPPDDRETLAREANTEVEAFRATMPADALDRARAAAANRLIRERLSLPVIAFE